MIPVPDKRKAIREVLTAVSILAAVGLFVSFVWPTRYERGERRIGQTVYPIRVHRFSRRVELLSPFGWETVSATPDPDPVDAPPTTLAKVMLQCTTTPYRVLDCDVVNTSDWSLSEITVTVRTLNNNGTVDRARQYAMIPDSRPYFDPGDTTKGLVHIDFSIEPGKNLDWTLSSAKGVGPH